MRDVWVISDTHFGHEKIIPYCGRPFSNAAEMDEAMIEQWNATVKPGDLVWHCGDIVWRGNGEILRKLHGTKRLILGNHDDAKALVPFIQKIVVWREFPEFDLIMSHVPVHDDALKHRGGSYAINVHGHIHDRLIEDPRYVNVSVEHTNYTPVHIESLAAIASRVRAA